MNTSHAVMSQRVEPPDSLDDFPTPPWAVRALIEHVLDRESLANLTCLEPSCGVGYMSRVLKEYFKEVISNDIYDYGYGEVRNYLSSEYSPPTCDWVITNPPFKSAEQFAFRSFNVARAGFALFTRTVFLESVGRYENLFSWRPPTIVGQFVERVPILKGRLSYSATTATSYAWMVWDNKHVRTGTHLVWIPPCRKQLERLSDYPILGDQKEDS
jgi:hypothetical protein